MGIPFLHPWANRLAGFSYSLHGRDVRLPPGPPLVHCDEHGLPIHGLLAASRYWEVVALDADGDRARLHAALDFGAHAELMAAFPFRHEVRLEAALTTDRLTITTRIRATGGAPVPISFGFHPYLRLPGADRAGWHVALPARRHLKLDDRGVPTGETEHATRHGVRAGGPALRRRLRRAARRRRVLGVGRRPDDRRHVRARVPVGQVFAPAGSQFICFEPMTAPDERASQRRGPAPRHAGPGVHGRRSRSRCAAGSSGRGDDRAGVRAHDRRMTTAVRPRPDPGQAARAAPADVFVVFGITGDLAKVMTLHSLYRLEARGLLTCPIVGVAVDDWTVDDLRERAREAIVASGERLDRSGLRAVRRPPVLPGGRLRGPRDVRAPRDAAEGRPQPGLLPRDPAVPVRRRGQGAGGRRPHQARARRRREAVRPRPRVGARARGRDARAPRRAPALPDRPLPREARHHGAPVPALREHDPRAGLAPQLRRERPDHDGRELRRRGPRALLRPGRRAARRGGQPPHAGRRGGGDGGAGVARSGHDQERPGRRLPRDAAGRPGALRPRPARRLPRDRRGRRRLDDRDLRGDAAGDRQLALVGRAVLHPHRQAPAGHADRAAARVQATAAAGLPRRPGARRRSARGQARSLHRRAADARGATARARRARAGRPRRGVRHRGRSTSRRRTRCCCTPRCRATARASSARTASSRRGASCSRWSTRRHRSTHTPRDRGARRRRIACSPATVAGTNPGCPHERLRRHRDRQRRRGRHARPPPRAVRQARAAAGARRLAAARAAELAGARRLRRQPLRVGGHLVRRARQGVPAAGPLLRGRRHEAVRRRAVPSARGGLRRAAPLRRHLARVADRLRGDGALLHARRAALRGARRARRGPDRAARRRRRTRSPRSATSRASSSSPTTWRPPGTTPSTRRAACGWSSPTCRTATACGARRATASRASCTRSRTPRCSASGRRSSTRTSR